MKRRQGFAFSLTALAAALLAAFGHARAEEADEVKQLTTPTSEASVGIGYVDNENTQWGKYTGMTDNGVYGLLDLNIVNRDDATGTWLIFRGRNLGLDDREFRFDYNRQGNWGLFLEYSQLPFNQPLTIVTRTSGIGTPVQNPAGLPFAVPYELETRRDIFTAGINKVFGNGFDVSLRYRDDNKEGNRRYGRQGPDLLAEPIDFEIQQFDGVFSYSGEKLQIQLGYYGTSFDNSNAALYVPTVTPGNALSLPPDNQSHQGYLSGGYNFTPTTRGNFKVSYTEVTQNEAFFAPTNNPAISNPGLLNGIGRTSLDGKVDTTLAEAGIVSRPLPKLTLRADWRYEDRDDKTPKLKYVSESSTGCLANVPPNCSRDGFNVPMSRTTNLYRGEAQYLLPMGFRVVGGIEYNEWSRLVSPAFRQVSWREDNDEWSYRVELSRSLSETLNGRLQYTYSDKSGSAYLPANNNAGPDVIDPLHWAERTRNLVRLRLDWVPFEELSLQFTGDYADDEYDERPSGPIEGKYESYSIDANYVLSDNWQLVGWLSQAWNKFDQGSFGQSATAFDSAVLTPPTVPAGQLAPPWTANLESISTAVGVGVKGRITSRLSVGADLQYQEDKEEFSLTAPSGSLPDTKTVHTLLTLFGTYAMSAKSGVKLQYTYDRWSTNDWAWQNTLIPFAPPNAYFTNGSLAYFDTPQHVHFVGASYYYSWQ